MPRMHGTEVAKELLAVYPHWERVIFASAYVKDAPQGSITQLKQIVELLQIQMENRTYRYNRSFPLSYKLWKNFKRAEPSNWLYCTHQ